MEARIDSRRVAEIADFLRFKGLPTSAAALLALDAERVRLEGEVARLSGARRIEGWVDTLAIAHDQRILLDRVEGGVGTVPATLLIHEGDAR